MRLTLRKALDLLAVLHNEVLQAAEMPEAFGEQKLENTIM